MIKIDDKLFILSTQSTTYAFEIMPNGVPEHLYYGAAVGEISAQALRKKRGCVPGNSIVYDRADPAYSAEDALLECSAPGTGDLREPFAELVYPDGSRVADFVFESAEVTGGTLSLKTMPTAYDDAPHAGAPEGENAPQTLLLTLRDKSYDVQLTLSYTVYPAEDVITRAAQLTNHMDAPLRIDRLMSLQLDLGEAGLRVSSFHGAWAREMQRVDTVVNGGSFIVSSNAGVTGSRAGNFVMLSEQQACEDYGAVYGFHLLYSGDHYEALDVGAYGSSRFVCGINPRSLTWQLNPGETFETPEAVMCYTCAGFTGLSLRLAGFVRRHIIRGPWRDKPRPILMNSWEATYFNFNESKLLALAKKAQQVGIELFVLDDGWFGERDNDTRALGDWTENRKKLPGGLAGLARKINDMGMSFGIWVEPEMVNEDSELYRAHPDWAVKAPRGTQALGRNQMLLDLTRAEVQQYVIDSMRRVFGTQGISYVKWDMNRIFTARYSAALPPERQGEFSHRYVMALYHILDVLTKEFPHILFEACASGGNRADLGMLCYMQQLWASDNTDAICRAAIQQGYSYGYPMSVLGAHVSACPNHQTLRSTPLDTRFNVAAFGLLGYECNLAEMSGEELAEIKRQVALYKQWREVFFFGDFYRLPGSDNTVCWQTVYTGTEGTRAVGMLLQTLAQPNAGSTRFRMKGLEGGKRYRFCNVAQAPRPSQFGDLINAVSPVRIKRGSVLAALADQLVALPAEQDCYTLTGAELMHPGVALSQAFSGTGYDPQMRFFPDFASRLYLVDEADAAQQ